MHCLRFVAAVVGGTHTSLL